MKKCPLVLLCTLTLFLSACSGNVDTSSAAPPGNIAPQEAPSASSTISLQDTLSLVEGAIGDIIPYTDLSVKEMDSKINIIVTICNPAEITYFATYVDGLLEACSQSVDETQLGQIQLDLCDEAGIELLTFQTVSGGFGELIDMRSAETTQQTLFDLSELMELFPASKILQTEEETLSKTDLAIYTEVWAALDAEPSRSEDDIFEELAPKYGMTGGELKSFIMDAMGKIYS